MRARWMWRGVYAAACLASSAGSAGADVPVGSAKDWKLAVGAQIRPRLVVDSGRDLQDGDTLEREYVTQRSRLTLSATHDHGHQVYVQIQDVRQWGELSNPQAHAARGLDVHQAYAALALPGDFTLKLGRQELILDDHRLIGNLAWAQRGLTFDGATAQGELGPVTLTALGFVISERDQDPDGAADATASEVSLVGLHGRFAPSAAFSGSALALSRRNEQAEERRHTAGVFAKGAVSGFTYQLDAYMQLGTLADEDISAWLVAGRLGYSLPGAWQPGLMLWYEGLSGDGKATGVFDTLYATNHKFYGEMDFFVNIPAQTAALGLQDLGGRLTIRGAKPVGAYVDVHAFSTFEESAGGETALGTEIDAVIRWDLDPGIWLRAVYGVMLPGDGLGELRGAPDPETEHMLFVTANLAL